MLYLSISHSKMDSHIYEDILRGKKITLIQTPLCLSLSKVCIFWLGTVTFLALFTCMTRNSSRQQRCFETETTDSHISHWAKFIVMPQWNCKLLHVVDLWGHLREVKTMTDQSANADGWIYCSLGCFCLCCCHPISSFCSFTFTVFLICLFNSSVVWKIRKQRFLELVLFCFIPIKDSLIGSCDLPFASFPRMQILYNGSKDIPPATLLRVSWLRVLKSNLWINKILL